MKTKQTVIVCVLCAALTACGERNGPTPKDPVFGATAGTAALGLVANADVTAYAISANSPHCAVGGLQKIGTGKTDETGQFNFIINYESGYVLYVLKGGIYTEEATGKSVALTPQQELRTVSSYSAAAPRNFAITPWSHLQTGLFCRLIESVGLSPPRADAAAAAFIREWLHFDPRYVGYRDPTDASNARLDVPLDDGMQLGFLNAALSEWTRKMSLHLENSEHLSLTSVHAAKHFYEDIYNDGVLDGKGHQGALFFVGGDRSPRRLSAQTYRTDIPRALLDFYDKSEHNQIRNRSGRGKVYRLADNMNGNTNAAVFREQGGSPSLDATAPRVTWLEPVPRILSGLVNISILAEDLTGTESLEVWGPSAPGVILEETDDLSAGSPRKRYLVSLDTAGDGSGEANYLVRVRDVLGNNQTYHFQAIAVNDPPSIRFLSADHTRSANYQLDAEVTPAHTRQQVDSGECILANATDDLESYPVTIVGERVRCLPVLPREGEYLIRMRLCDSEFSSDICARRAKRIVFDRTPPMILSTDSDAVHSGNVSLRFRISDTRSFLTGLPVWTVTGNGEAISGEAMPIAGSADEYAVFFDSARFGSGDTDFTLRVADNIGNEGVYQKTLFVFNRPPTVTLNSSPLFARDAYAAVFDILENSYSNLRAHCRLVGRTGFVTGDYLAGAGGCPLVFSNLPEGEHTLEIRVCGDYNLCTLAAFPVYKDTSPPVADLAGFPSFFTTGDVHLLRIRIRDLSNITLATYAIDGGAETHLKMIWAAGESDPAAELAIDVGQLATGRHSVVFRIRDAAGNLLTRSRSFAVLRDRPSVTLVSDELTEAELYGLRARIDPGTYTGLYTATCQINNRITAALIGGNLLSCQLDMSSRQDGTHRIRILLTADYGRGDDGISYEHTYENEVTVIKDTTAPEIRAITELEDEYTTGPVAVSFRIADAVSAVVAVTRQTDDEEALPLAGSGAEREFSLPTHLLATGTHELVLRAADTLGHTKVFRHVFLVLRDEPSLVRTSAERTREEYYQLTAAIDAGSWAGGYTAFCSLGGSQVTARIRNGILTCPLDMGEVRDGTHAVRVMLTADYGHGYQRFYEREITVIKDTTAPEIRAVNGLADEYTGGPVTIALRITDAVSAVISMTRQTDDGEELPIPGTGAEREISLPTHILATGAHELVLRASDTLGHTRTFRHAFLVLRDEPSLTRTSAEHTNEEHYQLTAEIDAGSWAGGYTAVCSLGGSSVIASIRNNVLVCPLDMRSARDGTHAVRILLTADYGHDYRRFYRREITVIKDTVAPEIRALAGLADEYTDGPVTISFRITDAESAVVAMTRQIDDGEELPIPGTGAEREISLSTHLLATGTHILTLRASDTLGHTRTFQHAFLVLRDEPALTRVSAGRTNEHTYSLVARLDSGTYAGNYDATCKAPLSEVVRATIVRGSGGQRLLRCLVDITQQRDGGTDIRIQLVASYGRSYTRILNVIKDRTPPDPHPISAHPHSDEYDLIAGGSGNITLRYRVTDAHSPLAGVVYSVSDIAEHPATPVSANIWEIVLHLADLPGGEHTLRVVAADTLENAAATSVRILIIKQPPRIDFTHPVLVQSERTAITGTYSIAMPQASLASVVCSDQDGNFVSAVRATIDRQVQEFSCRDYDVRQANHRSVRVRACDIYGNCGDYVTHISHDGNRPNEIRNLAVTSERTLAYNRNDPRCGGRRSTSAEPYYRNVPADCPRLSANTADYYVWEDADAAHGGNQITEPILMLLPQSATRLNASAADPVHIADMNARGVAYLRISVRDSAAAPGGYHTFPENLNITYSYTQIRCRRDTEGTRRPYAECARENFIPRFTHRPLPFVGMNEPGGFALATVAFTDEFLNAPGQPLWYAEGAEIIHRIELKVCDEVGNCIRRKTRFRVRVLAEEPLFEAEVGPAFANNLRRAENYGLTLRQQSVRIWRIRNTFSDYPVWVRFEPPARTEVTFYSSEYRKVNSYRRNYVTQTYVRRRNDTSCGRTGSWPFTRVRHRRFYRYDYLANYYRNVHRATPSPHGNGYPGHVPDSQVTHSRCEHHGSGSLPAIPSPHYQTEAGFPKVSYRSPARVTAGFASVYRVQTVNRQNEATDAIRTSSGYYRIPAGEYLIIRSVETIDRTPETASNVAGNIDYSAWKRVIYRRETEIPLSLWGYYTLSVTDVNGYAAPDLSARRSFVFAPPFVRARRPLDVVISCRDERVGSGGCRSLYKGAWEYGERY